MRTWIIGSGAECDLVVALPTVSGRHCRLTQTEDGFLLEDLGSSNGTYVNGERIGSPIRVRAFDAITLGTSVPMPWPELAAPPQPSYIRIGRSEDNDIVLDDLRVSGNHAHLIVAGGKTLIEDLGSSNGTYVNSLDRRVMQAVPLHESDVVYFGSLAVPAARLLGAATVAERPSRPAPGTERPRLPHPAQPLVLSPPQIGDAWTILVLSEAPAIAILILLWIGRQPVAPITAASLPAVVRAIAAATFALALSAIWLGGSVAVWGFFSWQTSGQTESAPRPLSHSGTRIAVLAALCTAECVVLLAIVHAGCGLNGDWLAMCFLLFLSAGAGLSLGLLVCNIVKTPQATAGVLIPIFALMVALGGWILPLPEMTPVLRPAAAVMPSRWAFEGLLLLESAGRPLPADLADSEPDRNHDLAEGFFPLESERMGLRADAMALAFMLTGLMAATVFIALGFKAYPQALSSA
jgi:pSer/pThr/pTyr-binding forkhead associated (FHA) protein